MGACLHTSEIDISFLNSESMLGVYQWNKENFQFTGKIQVMHPTNRPRQATCFLTRDEFTFTFPKVSFLGAEQRETVSLAGGVECRSKVVSEGSDGKRYFVLIRERFYCR